MLTNDELNRIKDQAPTADVLTLISEIERLRKHISDYSESVTQKVMLFEKNMNDMVAENARLVAVKNSMQVERDACLGLVTHFALASGHKVGMTGANTVVLQLRSGQVSWKIDETEAHLFTHLPVYAGTVEELTIEEKYQRVMNAGASLVP